MKTLQSNTLSSDATPEVRFCLNCDDMDDLAVTPEDLEIDGLHQRFENCVHTGRFDGDLCSRIFVADDDIDSQCLFTDDAGEE